MDREQIRKEIIRLIQSGITTFLSGGMGWFDAVCEHTVADLKSEFPHIKLYLILPYCTFQTKCCTMADETIYPESFKKYSHQIAMIKRNQYLVDHASAALCYVHFPWGDAAKTYAYAKKQAITIIPIPNLQ